MTSVPVHERMQNGDLIVGLIFQISNLEEILVEKSQNWRETLPGQFNFEKKNTNFSKFLFRYTQVFVKFLGEMKKLKERFADRSKP